MVKKIIVKKDYSKVLDSIRPMLKSHGGDIEFVGFKKGVYKIRLKGICLGCPYSQTTFENVIVNAIKKELKEVKEVKLVK